MAKNTNTTVKTAAQEKKAAPKAAKKTAAKKTAAPKAAPAAKVDKVATPVTPTKVKVAVKRSAQKALDTLNLKGARPTAVRTFLETGETDNAGMVRRGMRQIALRFERNGEQATADNFWTLRDSLAS